MVGDEYLHAERDRFDPLQAELGHGLGRIGDLPPEGQGGGIDHLQQPRSRGGIPSHHLRDRFGTGAGRFDLLKQLEISGREAGQTLQPGHELPERVGREPGVQSQAAVDD